MDTRPMWKRILAWQLRSQRTAQELPRSRLQHAAAEAFQQAEALTPAFIIARKSEVAVQRELAKVMW